MITELQFLLDHLQYASNLSYWKQEIKQRYTNEEHKIMKSLLTDTEIEKKTTQIELFSKMIAHSLCR